MSFKCAVISSEKNYRDYAQLPDVPPVLSIRAVKRRRRYVLVVDFEAPTKWSERGLYSVKCGEMVVNWGSRCI